MDQIASLIKMFPFGAFLIILAVIEMIRGSIVAICNRNRPVCDCDCCDATEESEEESDDESEDKPEDGPVIMGGEEQDNG